MIQRKSTLYKFSQDTSLHGFKRLWIGSVWRWPCWSLIILVGIGMSVYHIVDKISVLVANPLNVNIQLVYKDEIEFPSVTICNKQKVRVSFIVNNTEFLDLLDFIFPSDTTINVTEKHLLSFEQIDQNWNAKEFFLKAGIPKEQVILWCRLPNGKSCSSDDFETVITDEGYCFKLKQKFNIKNTGRGTALRLLLNLAQYERMPDVDMPAGIRLVIHEHDEDPMPGNGYDLMPGYQVAIVIRKNVHSQMENCESANPLKYYKTYTYPACRIENTLIDAAVVCDCKPYTLPELVKPSYKNSYVEQLKTCSLMEHFVCMEHSIQDLIVLNKSTIDQQAHMARCTGECHRREFEQELYYNTFREGYAYKNMLGHKLPLIQEAYQLGRDAGAFLNFYHNKDNDYHNIYKASSGYRDLILGKKLVPPFGTIFEILLQQLPCLDGLLASFGTNTSDIKSLFSTFNTTMTDVLMKIVSDLDSNIDELEIDQLLNFSISMKEIHFKNCVDGFKDICSLPALYDMLKIRARLETKKDQIEALSSRQFKNLTSLAILFEKDNVDLAKTFKHISETDRKELKLILDDYVKLVNVCLSETYSIYDKILTNGQPSMSSEVVFDSFLENLQKVKTKLSKTCKLIGSEIEADFGQTYENRGELAKKIIKLITDNERNTMKSIRYNQALVELIEDIGKKFISNGYDQRLLNQSLFDIETMDFLLNKYLNQTTQEVFAKSEFFNLIYTSNPPFQNGVNRYKNIVTNHLMAMDVFFQSYFDKLIQLYPGIDTDLIHLQTVISMDDLLANTTNNTHEPIEHIICLKKAKFLLSNIELNLVGATDLDEYKQFVDSLIYSLKLYSDDIRSLKGFYQENIGVVKIYFRDMGVKESTQEKAYDFLSFLCDVGGIIGLWLGGSLLSFFETFDIIFIEDARSRFRSLFGMKRNSLKRPSMINGSIEQANVEIGTPHSSNRNSSMSSSNYNSCLENLSVNV